MALDKELRVKELNTSGSSAVKSIDPYGRHNFFAEQMKEVNGSMDGEMFSKLKKPKYDEKQLLLAIDADVDELIPKAPKDLPDVVLRSEYDALQEELNKANAKIEELNDIIAELRSKVSDLESQIAGLKSELDAALLRVAVAENSAEASADKFAQTAVDLQQAIQKSVAEAIERVSLEAQVEGLVAQKEALIAQIGSLEEQFKGKSAELAQGAGTSTGDSSSGSFTARIANASPGENDMVVKGANEKRGGPDIKWDVGPDIVVLNTTAEPLSVKLSSSDSLFTANDSATIPSGDSATLTVKVNKGRMKQLKPKRSISASKDKHYSGKITVTGNGETFEFGAKLIKRRKK